MTEAQDRRIGEALVARGLVTPQQLVEARARQLEWARRGQQVRLASILVEAGLVAREAVLAIANGLTDASPGPGYLAATVLDDATQVPAGTQAPGDRLPSLDQADLAAYQEALGKESERLGPYVVLGEVGRGGMGVVLKAYDPRMRRLVAIKRILGDVSADALQRLEREARLSGNVRHEGIAQVHEMVSQGEGAPYLVQEFVVGTPLIDLCRGHALNGRRVATIVKGICEAIEAAHRKGVLHRDLKPHNIMITSGDVPVVLDFGLAKRVDTSSAGLTRTGQLLGTLAYMPPEQAEGAQDIDARADVYGLGAVLYQCLTGEPPFVAPTQINILNKVLNADPKPPRTVQPGVHSDLDTVCMKCLEKDRARRYPSASALAEDLGRFLDGDPIEARPVAGVVRTLRRMRRGRARWVLVAALVVALGAALWNAGIERERKAQEQRVRDATRAEVTDLLDRLESGQEDTAGLRQAISELRRKKDPEATRVMLDRLDDVSEALLEIACSTYLEAGELSPAERAAGIEPIKELEAAVEGLRALPPGETLDPSMAEALQQASRIVQQRAAARGSDRGTRPANIAELIAARQAALPGPLRAARVICYVLLELADETSTEPLARYLKAEADPKRAIKAGQALGKFRGDRAKQLILWARDLHGEDSEFWRAVRHGLGDIAEEVDLNLRSVADHLYEAEAFSNEENHESCIASASRVIDLDPENARAHSLRARALWKTGDLDHAYEDAAVAIRLDPRQEIGWIVRLAVCEARGDLPAAVDVCDQAISNNPGRAWAWRIRATLRHKLRSLEPALTDASRAIELEGEDARNWEIRGKVRHAMGENEHAERDLSRAVALDPNSVVALINLSAVRWALGKYRLAESNATDALELAAGSPEHVAMALCNRAVAYQAQGNMEAAIRDLDRAVETNPQGPRAYTTRGGIRAQLGQNLLAVSDFDRALELDPREPEAWMNRGVAHMNLGNAEKAISDLDRAIQLRPGLAYARALRATIRSSVGDVEGAAADLEQAIRADPKNPVIWYFLGNFYSRYGDSENAVKSYARALKLNPKDLRALRKRGEAYAVLGKTKEALQDFDRILSLDPENHKALNRRAKLRAETGDLDSALADYDASLKLDPRAWITWLSRAAVRRELGNAEGAEADLRQAATIAPKSVEMWKDRALLLSTWKRGNEALESIQRAMRLDAGKTLGLFLTRGALREKSGDNQGAIRDYDRWLKSFPNDKQAPAIRKRVRELKSSLGN